MWVPRGVECCLRPPLPVPPPRALTDPQSSKSKGKAAAGGAGAGAGSDDEDEEMSEEDAATMAKLVKGFAGEERGVRCGGPARHSMHMQSKQCTCACTHAHCAAALYVRPQP